MNIVLVQVIGLYGIILSTVFSYIFISMPWLIHNLFKFLYNESLKVYLKDLSMYILVAILATTITTIICRKITNDVEFINFMTMRFIAWDREFQFQ